MTGTTAPGNWPDQLHIDRVHLEVTRNTDRPGKLASRKLLTERRAHPITGIRQHAAEAHTGRDHTIDLRQGDLRLRPCRSIFGRNARSLQPCPITRPTLGKEKTQRHHHRHFAARQRQRHQRLAVGGLAQRRSILRSDTDRMLALLRHRGVVDHQHGIAAADEPVRLNKQFCLQRRRIPDARSNEMVQLIIIARRKPLRHRLNALAIAGTDQPRHVKRTHLPPRLVTQAIQKRLEPASKLVSSNPMSVLAMVGPPKADHP